MARARPDEQLAVGAGAILAAAVLPVIVAILNAVLIIAAVIAVVAVLAAAAFIVWRLRHPPAPPPWQAGVLRAAERPAAAPREVHLHLHGASPADVAQALARLPATATPAPTWASDKHPAARKDQQ